MKFSVNSWPAAVVIVTLILAAFGFVVVLGWRSPATLATLGGAIVALVLGQARPALGSKPPEGS